MTRVTLALATLAALLASALGDGHYANSCPQMELQGTSLVGVCDIGNGLGVRATIDLNTVLNNANGKLYCGG